MIVKKVFGGYNSTYFLNPQGLLFGVGENYFHQISSGKPYTQDHNELEIVIINVPYKILKFSKGYTSRSLVVYTIKGLFGSGCGYYGEFGDGTTNDRRNGFKELEFYRGKKIGDFWLEGFALFVLLADRSHTVYVSGRNDYGELGLGTLDQGSGKSVLIPRKIDLKFLSFGEIVCQVSSRYHSLLLTDSGRVFSVGKNSQGSLGVKNSQKLEYGVFVLVKELDRREISSVCVGDYHSLFLSKVGQVFSCGNGSKGALGLGNTRNQGVPTKIPAFQRDAVMRIASGEDFSLFLTNRNHVFVSGKMSIGKGSMYRVVTTKPTLIQSDEVFVDFAAGRIHAAFVTSAGEIFTMGNNGNGQLGLGKSYFFKQSASVVVGSLKKVNFKVSIEYKRRFRKSWALFLFEKLQNLGNEQNLMIDLFVLTAT